ncbi:LOW QUALITY PROTEIN: nuclear autoantigenic sperm protein [Pristis pectinata]|uniref:LOW QUALITY PROTEIN: nuclear autoantigenic sperm protein n=1 Tax=Pristis pectinata TaxID=685728 RepID=UPI00223CA657|nr:LOW QUALITY PROTEIN: nuclear autoantigenic sperm protein [Pristis pectinata]
MADQEPSASTSSIAGSTEGTDVGVEAMKLLGAGKRHMVMEDFAAAVNAFQDACRLLSTAHGEIADECGEAYFCYGKALLELARMERGVLGNALQGVPDDDDDEDDEEETATTEDPKIENTGNVDGACAADASEGDDENEDTAEKDGESEEVDNLQLAWEMLELAKVIFKRQETKEIQLCAAQAYLKLGEVGIESENYIQAIEDFNECLNIQEKHLDPHNRLLAETHYQLGLAYSFNNQHDFSLKHFKESFSVIEKRLAMLTERIEKAEERGKSPAKDSDAVSEDKQEVEELKELLPEIKAKIEDAEESKDGKATKALQETLSRTPAFSVTESIAISAPASAMQAGKTDEPPSSSSNSVSNISHLVRKKRKPEDCERDNKDPKKAKQEESSVNGGCGDATHDRNGVPEKMESEEIASPKKSDPEAQSTS